MHRFYLFLLLCSLIGCKSESKKEIEEVAPITMDGEAYGSTYHIVYYSNGRDLNEEIKGVLEEFDKSVNTYIPDSYLTKFNQSAYGAAADEMLIEMLNLARNFNTTSHGYFDPSVAPLSDIWGFAENGERQIPSVHTIDSVMQFVGLEHIAIHRDSISKSDKRVRLSMNAMTGYVNDRVAKLLDASNVKSYLIEIGGEVYARGKKPDGSSWMVGIDSPIEKQARREIYETVALEDQALATSGNYRKFYEDPVTGQKVAHTMNPLTGQSEVSNLLSVTVIAKSCAEADAMATATMAMGLQEARKFVTQRTDLQFLLIWSEGANQLESEIFNGFIRGTDGSDSP